MHVETGPEAQPASSSVGIGFFSGLPHDMTLKIYFLNRMYFGVYAILIINDFLNINCLTDFLSGHRVIPLCSRNWIICVCVCMYIYTYIQGVPGGMDKTSGQCSLG